MFDSLSDRLSQSLRKVSGKSRLTEDNIKDTLREVRKALLEADVALPVVKTFVDQVRSRALGQQISKALNPGQQFLKIVETELVETMGSTSTGLDLAVKPPAVILMAGLQGAGKTTSVAKLARYLKDREKKKVLVVSADVYRPAAIQQLETLAGEVGVDFFPSSSDQDPVAIAKGAIDQARRQFADVVIVDTAGRLHIDETLMQEIKSLHSAVTPAETLFVIDAMIGQDAVNTAKAFNDALPLTGVVLTKVDGDARGGAALSVRQVTGKPIKFLGVGEKVDALEVFHPDRIVSRILGMGDVMSLIEEAEQKIDRSKADRLVKKMSKGQRFDLEDLRDQLQQMQNMGGLGSMMEKMPGMGNMSQMVQQANMGNQFKVMETIINSMTPAERRNPDNLNGSRKRRITQGSGTQIQDLNRLLKQYKQMAKMMKKMKGGGMQKMMRGMGGMFPGGGGGAGGMPPGGGLPPGFPRK
ncbi:signal recognition particle protein [Marinimicrobium sp. ABcell2]|uniref:signal recognition particle protein n=1 Tax=Marinimicrobium sp. ABcell2 TaxID=3069751 RepID=UPI0027B77AE3|nr:signal recognition particle protein [Marinimicrobium sp. ABcell2]MDQ2075685.1 signal recognition particle protein [Marinimicrobium sp. ABcell2]